MIVAIIQASTGSRRLPRKVLANIEGKPMLTHIIDRIKKTQVDNIIVATTLDDADMAIIEIAMLNAVSYFANEDIINPKNLLDKYYQAAKATNADIIVRITADCPLIDPQIVDTIIYRFLKGDCDYASNVVEHERTYPDGLDVEVFSFKALGNAWDSATDASDIEHVTPYIHHHPDKFRIVHVKNNINLSALRWTVDYAADLEFARQVYHYLYRREGQQYFYMQDVLNLLKEHPELAEINKGIGQ